MTTRPTFCPSSLAWWMNRSAKARRKRPEPNCRTVSGSGGMGREVAGPGGVTDASAIFGLPRYADKQGVPLFSLKVTAFDERSHTGRRGEPGRWDRPQPHRHRREKGV